MNPYITYKKGGAYIYIYVCE